MVDHDKACIINNLLAEIRRGFDLRQTRPQSEHSTLPPAGDNQDRKCCDIPDSSLAVDKPQSSCSSQSKQNQHQRFLQPPESQEAPAAKTSTETGLLESIRSPTEDAMPSRPTTSPNSPDSILLSPEPQSCYRSTIEEEDTNTEPKDLKAAGETQRCEYKDAEMEEAEFEDVVSLQTSTSKENDESDSDPTNSSISLADIPETSLAVDEPQSSCSSQSKQNQHQEFLQSPESQEAPAAKTSTETGSLESITGSTEDATPTRPTISSDSLDSTLVSSPESQ
ncbi:hypothetical protein LDENG_00237480, partial [Lucifuga dentata]